MDRGGGLLLAGLVALVLRHAASRGELKDLGAAARRRGESRPRGLEFLVEMALGLGRELERFGRVPGLQVAQGGLQPGLSLGRGALNGLAIGHRARDPSRAARLSGGSHSWLMPTRFIVIESRVVLKRSAPVTGRLSTPARSVGSGSWPAARADSFALKVAARPARAASSVERPGSRPGRRTVAAPRRGRAEQRQPGRLRAKAGLA